MDDLLLINIICHLAEHIETGEPADLKAAQGLMMMGPVYERFQEAHNRHYLPQARKPVKMIQKMLDA